MAYCRRCGKAAGTNYEHCGYCRVVVAKMPAKYSAVVGSVETFSRQERFNAILMSASAGLIGCLVISAILFGMGRKSVVQNMESAQTILETKPIKVAVTRPKSVRIATSKEQPERIVTSKEQPESNGIHNHGPKSVFCWECLVELQVEPKAVAKTHPVRKPVVTAKEPVVIVKEKPKKPDPILALLYETEQLRLKKDKFVTPENFDSYAGSVSNVKKEARRIGWSSRNLVPTNQSPHSGIRRSSRRSMGTGLIDP